MSKVSPRISIVLPFRDAEATLAYAVESIFKQSESNLELLAIDDGSTDSGPAIIREFGQSDTRVRCLAIGGDGIVAALNLGLAKAKAPFDRILASQTRT